ncbi:hypothetical protein FQA39_LY03294 [Lamprigera yunnana]|nr:hypothetical protein FQA39_LY03294 [Lamprigera yunnana]
MSWKNYFTRIFTLQAASDCKDSKDSGDGGSGGGGDPMEKLRENCRKLKPAIILIKELDKCTARVTSKSKTTETCVQELYDLVEFVDACVAKELFLHLK